MEKTVSRALLTIVALAFTFSLSAQYAGVEKGIITPWALYKKLYTAEDDPCDYILVNLNDDFTKTQNPYPRDLIHANYTKEEQAEFWKNASASRTIVKSEYYDRVVEAA